MMQIPRCPDCNNLDVPFEERVYCETCHGSGSPAVLGHIWKTIEIFGPHSWQYAVEILGDELVKQRKEIEALQAIIAKKDEQS